MPATSQPRKERHRWTLEQVEALGATTDLVTACSIVYGIGKSQAWERYHRGDLHFYAFKNGRSVVVPVSALVWLLTRTKPSQSRKASKTAGEQQE